MNTGENTVHASGDLALLRANAKPIPRTIKTAKARRPIPRVKPARAKANRLYTKLRKEYLSKHPYCQAFIVMYSLDEGHVIKMGGKFWSQGDLRWLDVPRSTQIHHKRKPKATYLNDTGTWLAVCSSMHETIESNKAWARAMGLLQNI